MKKLLVFFSIIVLLSSCAKDGDPGAQGPTGNANVKSKTFTITPGQWQSSGTAGTDYYKFIDLAFSEITQSVIDNGAVLVYLKASNGSIGQIPVNLPISGNSINFLPSAVVGTATVELFLGDYQVPNISINYEFKVVAIDGTARITHPEIDWNDPFSISSGLQISM
ncbi:MAG: hypothetical protein ACKVQV_03985 [Bacteroidia bacterium]